jgi:hypothetical protein
MAGKVAHFKKGRNGEMTVFGSRCDGKNTPQETVKERFFSIRRNCILAKT